MNNVGTVSTRYRNEDCRYGQTFNLHAFCLAKSETILGFRMFGNIFAEKINCYFDPLRLKIHSFSCDHSYAIAKGLLLVFENATLLSCWPHLIRNARKNKAKLRISSNYDLIVDNIKRMHKCGSLRMFMCMRDVMMKHWVDVLDKKVYAKWFYDT